MILSASRRTDIPRFYFDWFLNRLQEGHVLVRNPINHQQVSYVELNTQTIDCIAFITKNPTPMIPKLSQLDPYPYFVQFTLNAYGNDIEKSLPRKKELMNTSKRLSQIIGPERVAWRYSPILLSKEYTLSHHLHYFELFAKQLEGYTTLCRISFLEVYSKLETYMKALGISDVPESQKTLLAKRFLEIGKQYGMEVGGCGNLDLKAAGIPKAGCVDATYVSRVINKPVRKGVSSYRPEGCNCLPTVDIGSYNTCANGCVYCYANKSMEHQPLKMKAYDAHSPILCDSLMPHDKITTRNTTSLCSNQPSLFDAIA